MSRRELSSGSGTPGVCRCCLAVGHFRQLGRTYNWLGSTEHYATMLLSCFNIAIPHYDSADGAGKALICAVCVTQLRDAHNFKKQVELSQGRFSDVLSACDRRLTITRMLAEHRGARTKQEAAESGGLESEDLILSDGEHQTADETEHVEQHSKEVHEPVGEVQVGSPLEDTPRDPYDLIIAIEVEDEDPKSDPAAHFEIDMASVDGEPADVKPSVAELRADAAAAAEASDQSRRSEGGDRKPRKPKVPKKQPKIKAKKGASRGPKAVTRRSFKLTEEGCLKRNASTIIANSEVCPFKCLYNVYRCFYCGVEYEDPAELRSHTALEHALDKYSVHRYIRSAAQVCVDITDMSCSLCEETFLELNDLIAHISVEHEKKIDSERGTGIIPFKLTKDALTCFLCWRVFYTFHTLSVHMNEHLGTFACEVCGSAYATRDRLDRHRSTHDAGEFACSVCDKVFSTRARRKAHSQGVHEKTKRLVCRACGARFANYEQKVRHQVKVHDQEPMRHQCQFCNNVYSLRRLLMNHHRRDHLQVRNHRCEVCDKSFYLKSQYDNHRVTHTERKEFECDVCEKKFNRKGNLVVHMATHTGLRCFVCAICSCSFTTSSHLNWHKKKMHALLRNPPGTTAAPKKQSSVSVAHSMTVVNAAQIIEHSHAVPFKCRQSTFLCFYCAREFTEPELLRSHTRTHRVTSDDIVYSIKTKKDLVKVDITRLDCKLCEEPISDIATLKKHLIETHNKQFASNVADGVLPFRLTESLSCVVCAKRFPYFHVLNKHMNEHFNHFICEICGGGFATQARMNSHAEVHNTIDAPCPICGKVFKLRHRLRLHVQLIHERRGNQTCNYCAARFLDYHQKLKHQLEVHGERPRPFPCETCGKTLTSRRNLTRHVKRDHLRERNFACPYCEKKFFEGFTLKNHLAVHSKERNFKCGHCGHCYSTKKVLNDHIKRLHHLRKDVVKN